LISADGSIVAGVRSVIARERCRVSTHWSHETSPERGLATRKAFLVGFVIAVSAAATTVAAAQSRIPGHLPAVFDEATGQLAAGAEVADLATNTRAVTSASGATSLAGLGARTPIPAIRTIGCAALMVPATGSATDTAPITIVLTRAVRETLLIRDFDSFLRESDYHGPDPLHEAS
jgi:hypothetical protein